MPARIREKITAPLDHELRRYKAVIDGDNPVRTLEIITNDPRARLYFEQKLREHGIQGKVVLKE